MTSDCSTPNCAHGQRTAGSALPPAPLTAAHGHQDMARCSMEHHHVWVSCCTEEVCYLQGVMMQCTGQGASASCVPLCTTCQSSTNCLCSLCSLCLPYCLGSVLPGEQPTPLLCRAPWRPGCTCVSRTQRELAKTSLHNHFLFVNTTHLDVHHLIITEPYACSLALVETKISSKTFWPIAEMHVYGQKCSEHSRWVRAPRPCRSRRKFMSGALPALAALHQIHPGCNLKVKLTAWWGCLLALEASGYRAKMNLIYRQFFGVCIPCPQRAASVVST